MRIIVPIAVAASILVGGCGPAMSSGSGGAPDVITSEELREATAGDLSAYQAIQRLRPRWLRSRSTTTRGAVFPAVFVDGARYGELDSLRSIRISDVERLRFMDARDATTRYGTGYDGGVISVTLKR